MMTEQYHLESKGYSEINFELKTSMAEDFQLSTSVEVEHFFLSVFVFDENGGTYYQAQSLREGVDQIHLYVFENGYNLVKQKTFYHRTAL